MSYRFSARDKNFMKEALDLAKRAMGLTNPHPMVGAVIVKGGKIIARGYHRRFGADHAETDALKHATEGAKGGTMYVNIEPCHLPYDLYGPRISCVETTKRAGIKTIHIAMLDSNPEVAGKGRIGLEKNGIKTTFGLLHKEALSLNEAYHHFMTKKRPFVAATFSASLDGKIATETGDSKWITNEKARVFARNLRSQYQTILVGINTIIRDDPHLGFRMKGKKNPLRIILDSRLRIPLSAQVLRNQNVLIATTIKADKEKRAKIEKRGIAVLTFDSYTIPLKELLQELAQKKIISILVEGGGKVLGSFFDEKLVDKVYAFYSPVIIGGEKAITAVRGQGVKTVKEALRLKDVNFKRFGDNMLTVGYL